MSPASEQQVLERRSARQAALLECAATIARSQGLHHVTIGAVARCSGIGRSTVYSYFPSASRLVGEVIIDEMLDMLSVISEQMDSAQSSKEAIVLWTRATLNYIADGGHKLVREAASVELDDMRRAQIAGLHRQLSSPLMRALSELGFDNSHRIALQIHSLVEACVKRIELGHPANDEMQAAENFILKGLGLS